MSTLLSTSQTDAERVLELEWQLSRAATENEVLEDRVDELESELETLQAETNGCLSADEVQGLTDAAEAAEELASRVVELLARFALGDGCLLELRSEAKALLAKAHVFGPAAVQARGADFHRMLL